jgi:hypothetical protein
VKNGLAVVVAGIVEAAADRVVVGLAIDRAATATAITKSQKFFVNAPYHLMIRERFFYYPLNIYSFCCIV